MSKQYGTASAYGVDGTLAVDAVEALLSAFPETVDGEHNATIEELMSGGKNNLIGFRVSNQREVVNITLVPKSTTSEDDAISALKYPPVPCKIIFTPTPGIGDNTAHDLYGAASAEYIYVGGARRTQVRGRAGLQITAFRPVDGELTVSQLLTEIPQTAP
ncbi:MAG: hypothetical protein ABS95_01105 [Verrucomicrobia bacterium SCN 57-15]|nr:MAG: hypothetical protein ABS95_01105 [Verrucomicrobia bacterium SCN 57-15]